MSQSKLSKSTFKNKELPASKQENLQEKKKKKKKKIRKVVRTTIFSNIFLSLVGIFNHVKLSVSMLTGKKVITFFNSSVEANGCNLCLKDCFLI